MKNYLLTLLLITSLAFTAKSQYVTIPDPNFVTFLQTNYPQCMNGNQMDTTCSAIMSALTLDCSSNSISSIEGVQYFDSLQALNCSQNNLNSLPLLTKSLISLNCNFNHIVSIGLLPYNLSTLNCASNDLDSIPYLPNSLYSLDCSYNHIAALPYLPNTLQSLNFSGNNISIFSQVPNSLVLLYFNDNSVSSIPYLPSNLSTLWCDGNNLISLPILPNTLQELSCRNNLLNSLGPLPPLLRNLRCSNNPLDTLGSLPTTLYELECRNTGITFLPSLPVNLHTLKCDDNYLTTFPSLPISLREIWCWNNDLQYIPDLPQTLTTLSLDGNFNLSCLPHLGLINNLEFQGTAITCLPNYPQNCYYSSPELTDINLCDPSNSNNCLVYTNLSGRAFIDNNINCFFNASDMPLINVKLQLFHNGILNQQAYTGFEGYYSYNTTDLGNYETHIEISDVPFYLSCPINGTLYDTLTNVDSIHIYRDFALLCNSGFDITVHSIINDLPFLPSSYSGVQLQAGDITNFYGAHCAAGVAGAVTVVINGPAHYTGPANGALTPTTVNGDTITWDVTDFGAVNALTDFNIVVQTDTTAPIGSQVCFTVNVTPIVGDNNPTNNTLIHCFTISNSYDPNEKEVYPTANIDTAQEWLTYTVHFQNTGTAEAQHIYVMDTLDANVDEGSFQLLAYSHQPNVQINEKIVRFNFPNINLPDSTSDEPNSHGYVQYKVKLKHGLPIGTQISNTAYIYFDFNSPVVTNTVTNTIAVDTSVTIGLPVLVNDQPFDVTLYPNPAIQQFTISATAAGSNVIIYNTVGNVVANFTMRGTAQTFNISNLPSGVYIVKVTHDARATCVKRLVKY